MPDLQPIKMPIQSAALSDPSGSQERLINLFAEEAPTQARSKVYIRNCPGLVAPYAVGIGPVYAINSDLPGTIYIVSGTHLFRLTSPAGAPIYQDLGSVGGAVTTGVIPAFISMASSPTQLVVCVPPNAFVCNHTDNALHQITTTQTGDPWPGAGSVAYVGGFFVFTTPNSSRVFCSSALDATSYDALDFAYADRFDNIILRGVSHLNQLWLMGQGGIETWVLSGSASFPFQPDSGGYLSEDIISGLSVAICDQSLFWMSSSGIVFRQIGYRAVRVSTHAVEDQIQQYGLIRGALGAACVACALSYQFEGHSFYALTLQWPSDVGRTWVYDCATQLWHERSSTITGNGRWRVNAAADVGGTLFGDATSGALFGQSDSALDDANFPARRIAVTPPLVSSERVFMSRLEIAASNTQAQMTCDWTDDDGQTWRTPPRVLTVTPESRFFTTRLGSYRRRSIRISTYGQVRIYGFAAEQQVGSS